jgi:hypothetical protein
MTTWYTFIKVSNIWYLVLINFPVGTLLYIYFQNNILQPTALYRDDNGHLEAYYRDEFDWLHKNPKVFGRSEKELKKKHASILKIYFSIISK